VIAAKTEAIGAVNTGSQQEYTAESIAEPITAQQGSMPAVRSVS